MLCSDTRIERAALICFRYYPPHEEVSFTNSILLLNTISARVNSYGVKPIFLVFRAYPISWANTNIKCQVYIDYACKSETCDEENHIFQTPDGGICRPYAPAGRPAALYPQEDFLH
jgi:hypothetical protein